MGKIKRLISLISTIIIFGYLTYIIDWKILLSYSQNFNYIFLILGVSIFIFYPIIVAFRWKTILYYHSFSSEINECLQASFHSFSLNLFAPAKSGDFIKVLSMKNIENKSKLFSIIISERLGDLIVLSGLIVICNIFNFKLWEFYFGILMLFSIFFVIFVSGYIKFKFKNDKLLKIQETIFYGLDAWKSMPFKMVHVSSFSLINWMFGALQVWLFFISLDINISYFIVLSIFPITVLVSIIPITPAGIGLRETAFVVFFSNYANPETCILAGILYFISSTILNSFLGSFYIKYLFKNE